MRDNAPCQQRTQTQRARTVAASLLALCALTMHIPPAAAAAPVSMIDTVSTLLHASVDVEFDGTVVSEGPMDFNGTSVVYREDLATGATSTVFRSLNCASADGFPPYTGEHCWVSAVAADAVGNVYVRSWGDSQIHKVAPDGTASVFAGTGVSGVSGDGGPALEAQILGDANDWEFPDDREGMDVGPDGSLFLTEAARVRKVDPEGIITTVAGTGTVGFSGDGGLATEALIANAHDLAVGADGSLFIATADFRVRKVAPDGVISTYVGTGTSGHSGDGGPAHLAQVTSVYHVATDSIGGLYLSDSGRIRYVTPDGIIDTIAGDGTDGDSGDGGPAVDATISNSSITDVAVDPGAGDVYINNHTTSRQVLRVITREGSLAGVVRDVAGVGVGGVVVSVMDEGSGEVVGEVVSAGDGSWWVALPAGFYTVHLDGSAAGLVPEFFDDVAEGVDATVVVVQPARETVVDAVLWYWSVCAAEGGPGPFSDVAADHLFCAEIEWLAQAGVAKGYLDETFRPTGVLTRGGAAAWLRGAFDDGATFTAPAVPSFSDVPVTHLFFEDIEWLVASGIANGYLDGTFRPSAALTRGGAAAWLYASIDDTAGFMAPAVASFSDVPVTHLFFEQIEWMAATGVTNGFLDGTFGVNRAVTRQGGAAFIARTATGGTLP